MVSKTDRARAAINAMKDIGFGKKLAAEVLKDLVKLYENNWELIEDENYRVLADAILDAQDKGPKKQNVGNDEMGDIVNQDLESAKMSTREETVSPSLNNHNSGAPGPSSSRRRKPGPSRTYNDMDDPADAETDSPLLKRPRRKLLEPPPPIEDRAIVPVPPQPCPSAVPPSTSEGTRVVTESGVITYRRVVVNGRRSIGAALKEPKPEPDVAPDGDAPLAVIPPSSSDSAGNRECSNSQGSQEGGERQTPQRPAPVSKCPVSTRNNGKKKTIVPCTSNHVVTEESQANKLDIASSAKGEFKLAMYSPVNRPMPSLSDFMKLVEEKCLHSYKFLPADFSLSRILNETCQALVAEHNPMSSNSNTNDVDNAVIVAENPQLALGVVRPAHDSADISKEEEKFPIPVFNEYTSDQTPPNFAYIPHNLVRDDAYLNLCLARIGDENCCADCYGDCLAGVVPCACARETGGEFAYTKEGLVRREFLDECLEITLDRWDPKNRVYCKEGECPVERSEEVVGKCKGHLVRKFIKECWSKCGCKKGCGNRVVQRGIRCQFQVFMTGDGRGWGLRTLEEIAKGAFVCEYVGEILTGKERQERYSQSKESLRNSHPVLLDANWAPRSGLKDEEAFCLDATFYGNVARFINHRCYDANLVEVPVEIETPDHLYYHVALFSSRKIEPLEELTWDYGIEFKETEHQNGSFKCICGSKYCRDAKRSRKGKGKQ